MKLVRSDAPEVERCVASAGARADITRWPLLFLVCFDSLLVVLGTIVVRFTISARAAAWLGVPVLLVLNGFVLWWAFVLRRDWVTATYAERVLVRLFARRGRARGYVREPDVLMLDASDIASVSIRTVEMFSSRPKSKAREWLVIELSQEAAEKVSRHGRMFPRDFEPSDSPLTPPVAMQKKSLMIHWRFLRPALREFLQNVERECPSVAIAQEERFELDLTGIWRKEEAEQRQLLVRAARLGFGCDCARLVAERKRISFREAGRYLQKIAREEAGKGDSAAEG